MSTQPQAHQIGPFGRPFDVLLEDGPLLAVCKPAGLATQAPRAFPSLERAVKAWLKERHAKPGNVYLGTPHRLDRPASGVVVFARNSKAAARMAEEFHARRVRKVYRAILDGTPTPREGTLTDWLRKVHDESRSEIVAAESPGAKEAVLHYRVLGPVALADREGSLLEIELVTGRMHQIRVQFSSRGWPVVGDVKYGARSMLELTGDHRPSDERAAEAIALHAWQLTLRHPIRYDELTITAPLPEGWGPAARSAAPARRA